MWFFFICHQLYLRGTIKLLQILIEKLIGVKITNVCNKISLEIQGSRKTYTRKKYSRKKCLVKNTKGNNTWIKNTNGNNSQEKKKLEKTIIIYIFIGA